ncbi:unnamed protein product [Mucor hiemalis]
MSTDIAGVITPSQKKLIKAWWKKVTINNPNALQFQEMKIPTIERGVFGIPLSESLHYASSRISYIDDRTGSVCNGLIPTIIAKCGAYLKDEALSTEGIFRLSGNAKRISMLQTIFDTPNGYGLQLDWRGYTVHDASNVMRRFLNYLPEPVITIKYQTQFKNTLKAEFATEEEKVDAFQSLIEQLPNVHQYLLLYLLDMLCLFSLCSESTKMDLASLATAFSPCIFSDPNDAMNPLKYKEAQQVVAFLIEHQDKFSMPRASVKLNNDPLNQQEDNTKSQQDLRRQNSRKLSAPTIPVVTNTIKPYSSPQGSHSVTDFSSFHINSTPTVISSEIHAPGLKRSKTAPSRRNKFGEYEPPQVVFVNNNKSSASRNYLTSTKTRM